MKTDPRTEVLSAVGAVAYTLPDLYGGWTVTAVSGGTVTRAGAALTPGAVLTAGDALTFTPTAPGGTTNLTIRQANAEFSGNYADLSGIPAGAGVDTEAVQDIVAAMLGSAGTYDDASGTYTLPPDQTLTPEQVQDIVAAFTQAGANATVTYDDAANTLTISATGGGPGGVTSVAGRTGAVTLTTADLPDLTEVIQDTVAAMLGGVGTYNDAAGTYTITLPQPRTDEEVQDIVAALIQAGGSVTKTYDDAGNVLLISVSGGGSGTAPRTAAATSATTAPGEGASLTLGNSAAPAHLRRVQTSAPCDVALYASTTDRSADYARLQTTPDAAPVAPIVAQYRTATGALAVAGEMRGVNTVTVYATVINRSGTTQALTLTLTLEDA